MGLFFCDETTQLELGDTVIILSAGRGKVRIILQRGAHLILLQAKDWSKPDYSLLTSPEQTAEIICSLWPNPETTLFERDGRPASLANRCFD